jgi:hypothetical protein
MSDIACNRQSQQDTHPKILELASRLASVDEAIFLPSLEEAVNYAPRGDSTGLEAMREAIRKRSGKQEIEFYTLQRHSFRIGEEVMSSREQLLQLAIKRALLNDPTKTGSLIAAFRTMNAFEDYIPLLEEINSRVGYDQCAAFQLIQNEMRANAQLNLTGTV